MANLFWPGVVFPNEFLSEDFFVVAIAVLFPLTAGLLVCQVNPYQALVIRGILGAIAALVYALFGAADVALTEALVGTMLSITLYAVAVRSSMSMRLGVLGTEAVQVDDDQREAVVTGLAYSVLAADQSKPLDPDASEDPFAALSKFQKVGETDYAFSLAPPEPANVIDAALSLSHPPDPSHSLQRQLFSAIRTCLRPYHLRLEVVPYSTLTDLNQALQNKDVHTICIVSEFIPAELIASESAPAPAAPQAPYHMQTRLRRLYEILETDLPPAIATLVYQDGSAPVSISKPELEAVEAQ